MHTRDVRSARGSLHRRSPLRPIDVNLLPRPIRNVVRFLIRQRAPWFVVTATGYMVVITLAFLCLDIILVGPQRALSWGDLSTPPIPFPIRVTIVGPILETLLFQVIPIAVLAVFTRSPWVLVTFLTALFAAAHGVFPFVRLLKGATGGFVLALSYVHWLPVSRGRAFWLTTFIHAFHNALMCVILLPFGALPMQ